MRAQVAGRVAAIRVQPADRVHAGDVLMVLHSPEAAAARARRHARRNRRPSGGVLLIAGDGPLVADLKALNDNLGLRERVCWLGWQSRPDAFYCLADVFVCPFRHETLGNVILEAWNYGLPVVATKTPGALELVEDRRSGLLVPLQGCRCARGLPATPANSPRARSDRTRCGWTGAFAQELQPKRHRRSLSGTLPLLDDLWRLLITPKIS